jgi:nucleoid-associated protein YgaU
LVIISTIVVALVLLLPSAFGATTGPPTAAPTEDYVVRSGDTLWDIAEERTSVGEDVRGTITSIRLLNDLDSSMIMPGEILMVPALTASG